MLEKRIEPLQCQVRVKKKEEKNQKDKQKTKASLHRDPSKC